MTRSRIPYCRIYKTGAWWTAYIGRKSGAGRHYSSRVDLEALAADCVKVFGESEVQLPSSSIIAEGLEPDSLDALDATAAWLEANAEINPDLLAYVRRALAAEGDRWPNEPSPEDAAGVAHQLGIAEMYLDVGA